MERKLIRAETLLDSDAAYEIYRACLYRPTREKYASRLAELRRGLCLACLEDGALAGLIALAPRGGEAEILGIAVDPARRGRGVGRGLVLGAMRAGGFARLTAETDDAAVGFYRKCGFTTEPCVKDYGGARVRRWRCALNELPPEESDHV